MTGRKLSVFKQIANRKGWTFEDIGERWGVSERQMSRIANSGNQRDIDAVNGLPNKLGDNMNELAEYLGLTDEQYDELDIELNEDTGSSGEMVYSYWFNVPETASAEILENTGWKVGQLINGIPVWVVDADDTESEF
ncbi:helix-turn-helix transcriptional regulator [Pseudoalteromonas sp. APC 3358]|uniref:helix-turn-helix transcriptional regulator n=1 Tax=unclassified Pseudoalteromonas TaxID=194690 RepID=UPI00067F5ABE|nr:MULTISPECIES: helix-turn-helix transcriptional regulator [unclassified Pseudoalteromonas]MDN3384396.1 helix-turn-helix transcriptional regulator [Pseudoalteromonas sp. APC 3358]